MISSLPVAMPQQSSTEHDDNIQHCFSHVAYVEELIEEYPSANIAFLGWSASTAAVDESMIIEDNASIITLTPESQDEPPTETLSLEETREGAKLPSTILTSKNPIRLKAQ